MIVFVKELVTALAIAAVMASVAAVVLALMADY